ncbi:unnamed protein product [Miscanthus lutarioriparius]|uniref:Uncharacterized protein n=1 Tax=Miscanthus lutarioriparius TaxID=422564 RepID=A0A811MTR2_9POAL|nr:unnamed protein product [Miscanthus lutarioriparius]
MANGRDRDSWQSCRGRPGRPQTAVRSSGRGRPLASESDPALGSVWRERRHRDGRMAASGQQQGHTAWRDRRRQHLSSSDSPLTRQARRYEQGKPRVRPLRMQRFAWKRS